jgi:hypothetical protein
VSGEDAAPKQEPAMMISLPTNSARASHLFAVEGVTYMVERVDCSDVESIDLPVSAYRAGTGMVQTMDEACCVARVTHASPAGKPLVWTWLSAEQARAAVDAAS